jgi:hypothetical protein
MMRNQQTVRLLRILEKLKFYSARNQLRQMPILTHMGMGGAGGSGQIATTQLFGGSAGGATYTVPQGATHMTVHMVGGGGGGAGGSAGAAQINGLTQANAGPASSLSIVPNPKKSGI